MTESLLITGSLPDQSPRDIAFLPSIDQRQAQTPARSPRLGRALSDGGLGLTIAGALCGTVATLYRSAPEDGMTDLVLLAESFTFNWAIANLVQLAARRPPPSAYAKPLSEAQPAFYSDRVALAAGLSTTATWLAFERHDELGWWSLAGGVALTSAVATGEIMKRDHFVTDVLAGLLIGGGIGALVPRPHKGDVRLVPAGAGLAIRGPLN